MQPISPTLAEFHLFPLLPTELRLKIWSYTYPHVPRTVHVTCHKGITTHSHPRRFVKLFTSPSPPPTCLHVCRESREEGLLRHRPLFRTSSSNAYTYIWLEQDTISMSDYDVAYLGATELAEIRRLVLHVSDCEYFGHYNMDTITKMNSLVELDLMADEKYVTQYMRTPGHVIMTRDFEDQKNEHPGWVCPMVRVVGKSTGAILGSVEAGALNPHEMEHLEEKA